MSLDASQENWANRVQDYWTKMGRLKLWAGTHGMQSIQDYHRENVKTNEAAHRLRRSQLGYSDDESETDEMGNQQTILGDVTNPTPIVVTGSQSSALGPLLAALLGAAIPGAGFVGYLLNQAETPAVQASTDETVEIGLGRIEDYLQPSD